MANSYTAIPNIVPGNLTVNGNLKVSGGQIAVGKFQQQYRIQEISNGFFVETVNLDKVALTQDAPTAVSQMRLIQPSAAPFSLATEPAGAPSGDTWLLSQNPTEFQVLSPALRVGGAFPYVRLVSTPPNIGFFSVNMQADRTTRDDLTRSGFSTAWEGNVNQVTDAVTDAVGNHFNLAAQRLFWLDQVNHHITGSTALQTVGTKTILGNMLGPFGAIRLLILGYFSTVAGGSVNLAVNFGGTNLPVQSFPAATALSYVSEIFIRNWGATNSQIVTVRTQYGTTPLIVVDVSMALDTTLNQALLVTTQAGNVADIIDVRTIQGFFHSHAGAI